MLRYPFVQQALDRASSVITAVLAFGGLFAGIRMGHPDWAATPVPKPKPVVRRAGAAAAGTPKTPGLAVTAAIMGFLDMRDGKPELYARKGSSVTISGWTVCSVAGSTLQRVVILIDNEQRAEVAEFFSRPDVAAAYARPDFEMSGWRATVPLKDLPAGEHTITARGIGSRGEEATLPAFPLSILQ
jgi:hypothetical protein